MIGQLNMINRRLKSPYATELRANEKHSTIGLLTRDAYDVSNVVKMQDFSTLDHLVGVVTQVLRFYIILSKTVKPDFPTTFDGN